MASSWPSAVPQLHRLVVTADWPACARPARTPRSTQSVAGSVGSSWPVGSPTASPSGRHSPRPASALRRERHALDKFRMARQRGQFLPVGTSHSFTVWSALARPASARPARTPHLTQSAMPFEVASSLPVGIPQLHRVVSTREASVRPPARTPPPDTSRHARRGGAAPCGSARPTASPSCRHPQASVRPSGANATLRPSPHGRGAWAVPCGSARPTASRSCPNSLEASVRPSGANATTQTAFAWPSRVAQSWRSAVPQLHRLVADPRGQRPPVGANATLVTPFGMAVEGGAAACGLQSHSFTVLSHWPEASVRPSGANATHQTTICMAAEGAPVACGLCVPQLHRLVSTREWPASARPARTPRLRQSRDAR